MAPLRPEGTSDEPDADEDGDEVPSQAPRRHQPVRVTAPGRTRCWVRCFAVGPNRSPCQNTQERGCLRGHLLQSLGFIDFKIFFVIFWGTREHVNREGTHKVLTKL